MFKKILVPTDGSRLSYFAIARAITFAKSINAAVYGFPILSNDANLA